MNLMKHKIIYFIISGVILIPGVISLMIFGLKPDIDFTGGSLLELKFEQAVDQLNLNQIRQTVEPIYNLDSLQQAGTNQLILRGDPINNYQKQQVLTLITDQYRQAEEVRFETVGPTLGKELIIKTITGVLLVALLIILYVWKQFKLLKFGICAVLGMFHDSLILLGSFSLLGHFYGVEVDVLFVTALLTTLSFSIHDTIVIYDRIRELIHKHPKLNFAETANLAVWETLVRSINNSITIIITLAALVILGGETIRWFATALLIGAISGTYSSTFVAVPLLLVWDELKLKLAKAKK